MAVGDLGRVGARSAIAVRPEATYGTFAVTTSSLNCYAPTSIGVKTNYTTEKLDELTGNRGYARQVQLDKMVAGTIDGYLHPEESLPFLINAMGGRYTFNSLTSAGDHSITTGNFSASDTVVSLSLWAQKGEQHSWRYAGGVINSMKLSAEVGSPVKMTAEFIFQDSSISSADTALTLVLSISSARPFTYVDGVYRYDASEGSLTSSVNEPIQSFELEINNNLVSDTQARQLGSRLLSRIPPSTRREVTLKVSQRFDTSTTYNRMVDNTTGSVQLFFRGESISAEYFKDLTITLPNVRIKNSEPLVEGANEVLKSDLEYDVLISGNPGTSTSRDIGMTLRNARTTAY